MAVSLQVIDGAEVRVETGKGYITHADLEGQGRNVRVEVRATHANLREPVSGWLDTTDSRLFEAVRDAVQASAEVDYVIHVKRKRDVDPSLPIAELGNRQKVRDLHAIAPAGSLPRQDAPQANPPGPGAANSPPGSNRSEAPPIPEQGPPPARSVRRGIRVEEAKPWERRNSDGSVNLGSYEATATIGMASLAYRVLLEKARADATARGIDPLAPSRVQVLNLGRFLLEAADAAQAAVRSDGCADRMDASHTRARGAIREALDAYPVPWKATDEERRAWRDTLAATAAMLLTVGTELLELPLGTLENVARGQESPVGMPAASPSEEPYPLNSREADVAEAAEARGEDPSGAIAAARAIAYSP